MQNFPSDKAKQIKLAIFDVDGVMTNGSLVYGRDGMEYKEFHVHDGLGLKLLIQSGIEVAIITSKKSEVLARRMQDLGIEHLYQGQTNKLPAYEDLKQKLNLRDEQIAYTGDDLPDLALIRKAGLGMTVKTAPIIMQQHALWITTKKPGRGAVREICDCILESQNNYQKIIESYL